MRWFAASIALLIAGCASDEESLVGESGFSDPSLCPEWHEPFGGTCQSGLRCRYEGGGHMTRPKPKSTCWTNSAVVRCLNGSWVVETQDSSCYPSPSRDTTPLQEDTSEPVEDTADGAADDVSD